MTNTRQRVYGAGVCRPGGSDRQPGFQSGFLVGDNRLLQRLRIHPVVGVNAHASLETVIQSGDMQGFIDTMMSLLGDIDDCLASVFAMNSESVAGGDYGRQVCEAPPRSQVSG